MASDDDSRGIFRDAGAALERARAAGRLPRCLVGFDGFIDSMYHVIDRRSDTTPGAYERVGDIPAFAARIAAAAGRSANIELALSEVRFGGNGPLMATALAELGCKATFIGAVGSEKDARILHEAYAPLAMACERVVPIARTGRTEALEFGDGKVMFNHPGEVATVGWSTLMDTVGLDLLVEEVGGSDLIAMTNWTNCPSLESIWRGLIETVFPRVGAARKPVFIDLTDPARRTDTDVARALGVLREMNGLTPVTLGLNLSEAGRVARVLGAAGAAAADPLAECETLAGVVREASGLTCVVVHRRHGAAAATASESTGFMTSVTDTPALLTGAGDHFNAGFACAQAAGLTLAHCLAVGCGVSGAHVRGRPLGEWAMDGAES